MSNGIHSVIIYLDVRLRLFAAQTLLRFTFLNKVWNIRAVKISLGHILSSGRGPVYQPVKRDVDIFRVRW